ncbi:MAG: ABC transporter ATP-binding protein [Dorea sp.]
MYFENEELKRAENNYKIKAVHLCKDYVLKEKKGMFGPKRKKVIHAVKDISLEIPQGNIIGVLGINGAGKTTTIRMLASVIRPSSGSLMMNGVDAVKNHLWVKERINMISGGERNLYWRLTAKENLRYFGSLYGLSGALLQDRIDRLLKIVGLEEAADIPVERYSKGMKQRLQIARGLINDPDYIFLDEPTLGLDIMIAKEIRQLILKLARKDKKGVLLTTHYISEAEELCDYIYVLDQGEMIARGTKEELKEYLSADVDGQEPGLEEVLMKIISQARSDENEEISVSHESGDTKTAAI